MIGGGVPKNFAQDTVICAEILGHKVPMHQYTVQITVADVRDGACSSSTLREASSWGESRYHFRANGLCGSYIRAPFTCKLHFPPRQLEEAQEETVRQVVRVIPSTARYQLTDTIIVD